MEYRKLLLLTATPLLLAAGPEQDRDLKLDEDKGYLTAHALDVIVFDDIYPDGHQTGVTIVQHGRRVAANGDVRLEPEPGQWSPMPVSAGDRTIDPRTGTIRQRLSYPDPAKDGRGFNPIFYPDLDLAYTVSVSPTGEGRFASPWISTSRCRRNGSAASASTWNSFRASCSARPG